MNNPVYSGYVFIDISGYLKHPSDNGLLDGLILRCTEFDAVYKLHCVFQKFKPPHPLYIIPCILGNVAHFYYFPNILNQRIFGISFGSRYANFMCVEDIPKGKSLGKCRLTG
jgi:hypothetical protein